MTAANSMPGNRYSALYIEHFGFPQNVDKLAAGTSASELAHQEVKEPVTQTTTQHNELTNSGHWALALGNAAVALPELATATLRQAGAAAWDALHNAFDVMGYLKQLRLIRLASGEVVGVDVPTSRFVGWAKFKNWLLQTKESDEAKLEKASFAWISLPAIGAAAIAGAGIVRELQGTTEHDGLDWADWAHMGAAGSALMLAFGLWRAGSNMKRKISLQEEARPSLVRHVENFRSHAKLDAVGSGVAVVEAIAHATGYGTLLINLATLAIAGYQTWRFWPSRAGTPAKNEQDHHHHDHDASCQHLHLVPGELGLSKDKLKQAAHFAGAVAVRMAGALSPVARVRLFLQKRQEARATQREQDNELRWWRWIVRVSESEDLLAPWAGRQLQSIPEETLKMLIRRD